jgi:hypothetical protein
MRGWSINLTQRGCDQEIDVPCGPLFYGSQGEPVVELVFWSRRWQQWVHAVAVCFQQLLPAGHVQMDMIALEKLR